jgi:CHAD domain-containing protein
MPRSICPRSAQETLRYAQGDKIEEIHDYRVLRKYLNLIVVIYPCFDFSKFTYLCKKQ